MESLLNNLRSKLSGESGLLLHSDPSFRKSLERWSNLGIEIPSLIALPASEGDAVIIIKEVIDANVPFVLACGGHSSWSTVKDGVIVDLSRYKEVIVDSTDTATIKGGVLMKDLQVELNNVGRFAAVGNGNTVGVIPYYINGGISIYTPLIGFACENIISARIITATGAIVQASATENNELLWGLRGAGQFFGLVISITIRTYPLTLISPDGSRQLGMYIFPVEKAKVVCEAMSKIVNDKTYAHAGHFMIVRAPPDLDQQVLLLAPQFFGSSDEMKKTFKPLNDLEPVQYVQTTSSFVNHSDQLNYMCAKGDFKKFTHIGVRSWDPQNFLELVPLHEQLIKSCPGSEGSGYSVEWHTPTPNQGARSVETSFGMKDIDFWVNLLSWYKDDSQHEMVASFDKAAQKKMRRGTTEEAFVTYTNADREDPIEYRYKGTVTLARLKKLKTIWDPSGAFTKQLLD